MINIREFPKSRKLLGEFGRKNLLVFQKNIMKEKLEGIEIPEITDEMAENYANALLAANPRVLFDFFDEQKIFITVDFIYEKGFMSNIVGTEYSSSINGERLVVEHEAFLEAFKQLEEKI